MSFFTVGEDECRAWSIPRGTIAQEAAGEIHSDIARGFIRAEVVAYDALVARGSMAACKEHGEVRLEGKEYVVKDGDIINFRHRDVSVLCRARLPAPGVACRAAVAPIRTVLVCETQVPLVRGGAELLVRSS